jgi:type I restriction enzyme S subunit
MAQYSLSPQADPNKIFLVNRSKLDGRIDSTYILQKIKVKRKYNYPTIKLSKLIKSLTGGTPSKEQQEYWDGDIYWVSPKDFKQFYIDKAEDTITDLGLKNSSTKLIPENSILVVVRSGVLIHSLPVAINTIPVTINQDVKALIPNKKILSAYLGYYFNIFNDELLPLIVKHSTTVQSVNTNEFDQLEVPVPPIEEQQIIINILDDAYSTKQQKEAEAKFLLESIDAYLLAQLGITLPEQDNSLKNRIFTTTFSEVVGGRIDPKLYDNNTTALKGAIENNSFKNVPLKSLLTQSAAGDWGKDENEDIGVDFVRCLVIRATEFDNQYNLKLENSRVKYRLVHKDKLAKIDIQENDLLIEKSGGSPDQPVGRIAIITKDMIEENQLCYSNFIHKIRVDVSIVNPYYLFCLLKTFHNIKLTDSMQSQTNGIRNLIMSGFFNQNIPLPFANEPKKSIEKQTEIANHIQNIRSQAKSLQQEAARVLEAAKREVEKMILGE